MNELPVMIAAQPPHLKPARCRVYEVARAENTVTLLVVTESECGVDLFHGETKRKATSVSGEAERKVRVSFTDEELASLWFEAAPKSKVAHDATEAESEPVVETAAPEPAAEEGPKSPTVITVSPGGKLATK
jgi:hypothetical protein